MPRLPGIGERIGDRLRALGYVKSGRPDVARFCEEKGYRPQYIYAWLAGRTPTYENIERLSADLEVSASWLAVGAGEVAQAREAAADVGAGRPTRAGQPGERRGPAVSPASPRRRTLQLLDFARLREVTGKLVQLEAQLSAIFEAFPDLYVWVDGAGEITDWKGGRAAVPDVLLTDCIGKRIDAVFPDDTGRRLRHAVSSAVLGAQPVTVEYAAAVEGVEHSFEARLMPLDMPGAPRPHVLIVVRDITDRLRAERAVRDSEARYRALVEGSIEGILINVDGVVRFANQALCDIYGYPGPEAVIGEPIEILAAPEERARLAAYGEARRAGRPAPARYEYQGVRHDGIRIWLESVSSVIAWDGRPAVLTTVQEITRRKQAQAATDALAAAARELASTLDLNEVVQRLLDRVQQLFKVARASLYELVPETGAMRCLAAVGPWSPEAVMPDQMPAGLGMVGRAVTLGRVVASPDILTDPEVVLPEAVRAFNAAHGFTATATAPLSAQGRVFGALAIGDTRGRVYTDAELDLLRAFGDHAALALDNARRHRELENRVHALEARAQG